MSRPLRSLSLALSLLTAAGLFSPASGRAESQFAPPGQGASASLNIRIIIPAVMQVLENSHPALLESDQPAEQRLVVLSNMRHGFCVTLRQTEPQPIGWRLQNASDEPGVELSAVADGYRLCTHRPGRYSLRLRHEFGASAQQAALAWPVRTELTAL